MMDIGEIEESSTPTSATIASIAQARTNLPALVKLAEQGLAVEITRRGKPVAMLLSTREYARLVRGGRGLWQGIQAFRREHDAEALRRLDIDEALAGVRDRTVGREVDVFGGSVDGAAFGDMAAAISTVHETPARYETTAPGGHEESHEDDEDDA